MMGFNYEFATVDNFDDEPTDFDKIGFDSAFGLRNLDCVAEDAAKEYYDNCDGWESTWPINFMIFQDGKKLGVYEVCLEFDPSFTANKLENNGG